MQAKRFELLDPCSSCTCVTRVRSGDIVRQQWVFATYVWANVSLACFPRDVMSFGFAAFSPLSCVIHRVHMSAREAFTRRVAAPSVALSEGESQLAVKLCDTLTAFCPGAIDGFAPIATSPILKPTPATTRYSMQQARGTDSRSPRWTSPDLAQASPVGSCSYVV